jgi:adenosylhomocysteinase
VQTLSDVVDSADIFVTATGNKDVITIDDMKQMKDMAIVCNIGHFDNEIQVAELKNFKWTNIKPQVDLVHFPKGNRIVLLRHRQSCNTQAIQLSWRLYQPDTGPNELFTNAKTGKYKNEVYVLPKHLDEKVASLHLEKLGVKLTTLRDDQAAYIGVAAKGPFKPDYYRY